MSNIKYLLATVVATAAIFGASGQQRTVIAGLEGNAEYRALIDREGVLVRTADSLTTRIASLRRELRGDTLARAVNSAAIVRMEEQGFEIRSQMARLASMINTIEQEWILENLLSPSDGGGEIPEENKSDGRNSPDLVDGSWFKTWLSPEQLAELRRAQEAETGLPRLVARYRESHRRLVALAREYELADSQSRADSIKAEFDSVTGVERTTDELIESEWGKIFDSKSYLYNLLADKGNRGELLARFEQGMENLRGEQSGWRGLYASDALVDYLLQKRMLTDYEIALATESGNRTALDSLKKVAEALPRPESLVDLEPVVLRERLFLDYSEITIGGSPYNTANPIPEVAIWPRGIVWRILTGTFSARQSPSIFRAAHPLAVHRGDDGRYRYFAGGFPTDSAAYKAVEQLRKAGFRAPAAVVWMDGVYINPATDGEGRLYRVELSGVTELSPETRGVIAAATSGDAGETAASSDIVRGGDAFIVTPLDGRAAIRLRSALETLKASHPALEAKLLKNSE